MEQELRMKRKAAERAFEAQAKKDRTLMRLEELMFLATSTKDLDDLLELMLLIRSEKNTKCVSAANEELTAAKHKLMLLKSRCC
nr:hypothetical protein [Tanacetum cinerariifolium]